MATSITDRPWKSREPTTAKPIYGGLARRVRLTRVAGREQVLRNDDLTFRPLGRTATPQNYNQYIPWLCRVNRRLRQRAYRNPYESAVSGRSQVYGSGRCVIDGVLERHDPRIESPTAGQLQLEPLRRRLCGQQWNALTEQHGDHRDLDGIH